MAWKLGAWGLANWSLGAQKWSLGLPNWRQNGSPAVRFGAWRVPVPPKLVLGRSVRQFEGIGARLDGHLGGPGAGLDAILGPHGRRPRMRFGGDFRGFGGPKRVQKSNFLDPKWKSAK